MVGVASTATVTTSCGLNKNTEKLIPYLVPPEEEILPGTAIYRATACSECSAGCGVSAKIREKTVDGQHLRVPTKLEGIEGHPVNQGALCIRGQSSITRLYHPRRIKKPLIRDANGEFVESTWEEAFIKVLDGINSSELDRSRNVYLSGRTTGSISVLSESFCRRMGFEKLPEYELFSHTNLRQAYQDLFGVDEIPSYRIENSDFMLSIGADLFETFVNPVFHGKQYSAAKKKGNFTHYHVEPHASTTGFTANHRYTLKPGSEVYLLVYILQNVEARNQLPSSASSSIPQMSLERTAELTGMSDDQISEIVQHIAESDNPILIAGGVSTSNQNGLACATVAGLIQWALGMVGTTVDFSRSMDFSSVGSLLDINNLSDRLANNEIGVIILSGTNPVGTLPFGSSFRENLGRAKFRVGLSMLMNETMNECDVILPLSHSLESWGDVESVSGIVNLIQPALEPLHDTMTEGDILLQLLLRKIGVAEDPTFQEHVLKRWQRQFGQARTQEALSSGFLTKRPANRRITLNSSSAARSISQFELMDPPSGPVLFVTPSMRTYDGRGRDLQILQEIPDTLSGISYGSWVSISMETGKKMQLDNTQEVRLASGNWEIRLPVRLQAGLPENVLMVQRDVLQEAPLEVNPATGDFVSFKTGIEIEKTGNMVAFPILSGQSLEHEIAAKRYDVHGGGEHHSPDEQGGEGYNESADMYYGHVHKNYRWAMAIDLDLCTGCGACVAACYIENNVPLTGADQHMLGREMSWIRIEARYGHDDHTTFQPILCQHCGNAPCEPVCPVFAAYHNEDGLNAQVYNRCVGTRYCSNNCPYKVRRFNWFGHEWEAPLNLMLNPELSVRGRGVMEKCTFCVQRIRMGKDHAKDLGRKVQDGEIRTACEQTCPSNAIVFGNLLDPESEVSKLSADGRGVLELEELNTKPAVTYLRKA